MSLSHNQTVLLTRQRHEAERAGLHWDYRIVVGDKAYSWATKKEMPNPGETIILWEQPVHTADYALSPKVVIPAGQYGAGVTTLDWVKKGTVKNRENFKGKFKIELSTGENFLFRKVPVYGDNAWIFKHLVKTEEPTVENKYLQKIASDMALAEKSKNEEGKAIKDYTDRLKTEKNPILRRATAHALAEERDHFKGFSKAISDIKKNV